MTIKTLKILLPFIFTTFILSCNQTEKKESNTKINENKSTIISTDKNKLGKLIDLNTYKPKK
ncbi:hypothetical protein DI487_13270 [Flavobacterium sediminis]|uniref:Lipoprotein n=1 Tax=Flavobacterium sediminis TaxID=2201181 RepID=A0A2U8QWZ1_9FLAO|nr:hypothetical protein DI487_13270 [Flavobacterium sediminis]